MNNLRSEYITQEAQTTDPAAALNVLFAYQLPFGKGHGFEGGNAVLRAVASDWELSGVFTYRSGTGFGAITGSCNLPNARHLLRQLRPRFLRAGKNQRGLWQRQSSEFNPAGVPELRGVRFGVGIHLRKYPAGANIRASQPVEL